MCNVLYSGLLLYYNLGLVFCSFGIIPVEIKRLYSLI